MRKLLMVGLIVALAFIIVGGVGVVYAGVRDIGAVNVVPWVGPRVADQLQQQGGYGPGMMGGYGYGNRPGGMMGGNAEYGYHHGGMMGGYGNEYGPGGMMGRGGFGYERGEGPMHDFMIAAFAEAVGLSVEDVETRLESGESLREIAIAQGIAEEDLPELFTQVRQAALEQAVADGLITQAQADWMLEHMGNFQGQGFGPGYGHEDCPMWGNQQP